MVDEEPRVFYLILFLVALVSPLIWLFNAEVIAVWGGLVAARPWALVALALAAGQCLAFSALFLGGDRLTRRVGPLRRRVERLQQHPERLERYRRAAVWWLAAAAAVGIPPLVALSPLAPALGVRFRTFALVALGGRTLRFMVLAGLPGLFADWLPLDALPDWLRAWS